MAYGLAVMVLGGVALAQQQPAPELPPEQTTEASDTPQRLTIAVAVTDPEDLKVSQGDRVAQGQLIADRTRERERLEAQRLQLELTLERLETATITPPLPPQTVPPILEPTYLEEEAAIARAAATVDQSEAVIAAQEQALAYLSDLANLDPIILEHETAKLAELRRAHTAAVRDYQLAVGQRASRGYDHAVVAAQTVSDRNRDALDYQQQMAAYEQRLRDRDFQVAQTRLRLDEVTNEIATLAVVRSPYPGRIRQVKWLEQSPDGALSVELTLLVRQGGAALSEPSPGLPSDLDDAGPGSVPGD
jgi:hypothetical protein